MSSKERLRRLDSRKIGHSTVVRVGEVYSKYRQKAVSAGYQVWGNSVFPERHRNWCHFHRAAVVIEELGASAEDYMSAQFVTATPTSYPYPSNLYSLRAIENYRALVNSVGVRETLEVMKSHLSNYSRRFDQPECELVYWPQLGFTDWFRVLYMDPSDIPTGYARKALKQLKDPGLRRVLDEQGYDLIAVEQNCQASLDGDHG